jgi:hypothetical protein
VHRYAQIGDNEHLRNMQCMCAAVGVVLTSNVLDLANASFISLADLTWVEQRTSCVKVLNSYLLAMDIKCCLLMAQCD